MGHVTSSDSVQCRYSLWWKITQIQYTFMRENDVPNPLMTEADSGTLYRIETGSPNQSLPPDLMKKRSRKRWSN